MLFVTVMYSSGDDREAVQRWAKIIGGLRQPQKLKSPADALMTRQSADVETATRTHHDFTSYEVDRPDSCMLYSSQRVPQRIACNLFGVHSN